jgi:hypothetical protein
MGFALAHGPIAPPKRARGDGAQAQTLSERQKPYLDATRDSDSSQAPDHASWRAERLESQPLSPTDPRGRYVPLRQPNCQCAQPAVHHDLDGLALCVWCGRAP